MRQGVGQGHEGRRDQVAAAAQPRGRPAAPGSTARRRIARDDSRRRAAARRDLATGGPPPRARPGEPEERRLHFARLDAEAADLDLVVDAAEELDGRRPANTGAVAGAVEALPGRRDERMGDEALGGEVGLPGVAAGEPRAAGHQLAGDPGRHRLEGGDRAIQTSVPATGLPIGTGLSTALGESIAWVQVKVVFSVGP